MSNPELASYIKTQLQSGIDADTIATQLRAAGWQEEALTTGFTEAQQALSPIPLPLLSTDQPSVQQLPPPLKQGRMKTGWMLFKQSLAIIKNNPGLSRYVIISTLITIGVSLLFIMLFVFDYLNGQRLSYDGVDSDGEATFYPTLLGFIVIIIWAVLQATITFYYATGLSSHALSMFRGQTTTYKESMKVAWSKIGSIITFALITVAVSYLINLLQRIRFVGWILSKIIGAVWSLATSFAVPLIADKNLSGLQATKESMGLFKQTWGETITSRVSLGGLFFLIYYLIALPVFIGLVVGLSMLIGPVGAFIAVALFIVGVIVMSVIEALATNILNVALYYYAQYKVIPPNFSPELLASVFSAKKKHKTLALTK